MILPFGKKTYTFYNTVTVWEVGEEVVLKNGGGTVFTVTRWLPPECSCHGAVVFIQDADGLEQAVHDSDIEVAK